MMGDWRVTLREVAAVPSPNLSLVELKSGLDLVMLMTWAELTRHRGRVVRNRLASAVPVVSFSLSRSSYMYCTAYRHHLSMIGSHDLQVALIDCPA